MNGCFLSLICRLMVAVAMGATLGARAQTPPPQEQRIIFSSPESDDASSNVPSLEPASPTLSGVADSVRAPLLDLNSSTGAGPFPGPAPMPSPQAAAQMQRQLEEKENWALLTPEEILGVPTAQKIMGLPETNAAGFLDNEPDSLAERYLDRQEQRDKYSTNGVANLSQWNLPTGEADAGMAAAVAIGQAASDPLFSGFLSDPGQRQNTSPSSLFGLGSPPPAVSAPTAEQIAADEAFQKLIAPNSTPADMLPPPSTTAFSPPPDTLLAKPLPNPLGASFTPLSGNMKAPLGANPLPTLFPANPTPIAPEWKPQPPPWMNPTPQPGDIPQRKF
jgi:hypothetical protein